jgi:purine-nucleoside phosphorylase
MGLHEDICVALDALRHRTSIQPQVGLVLGSGLGEVAEMLQGMERIPYAEIPHFPGSTAPGHSGNLLLGRAAGCPVAVLQGRFHYYEGYSTQAITFPIRVLAGLGARILLITNAAGGLNPLFRPGDLMIIADQIHMIPENPLRGIRDERLGDRFPDMSRVYDPNLIQLAEQVALSRGIPVGKGVYVSLPGPSLETPAETRLLRAAGADAVGMSTTPEVIVARSVGMRVLGLSVISNVNRPDCMEPILVDAILAASREAGPRLRHLLEGILGPLGGVAPSAGCSVASP